MARVIIDSKEAKNHPLWTEDSLELTDHPGTFLKEGYIPEIAALPAGDLRLQLEDGRWLVIELKTIPDFISTLRDTGAGRDQSRIRHQASGLLALKSMGQIPAVMIIGQYRIEGAKIKYGEGRRSRSYSARWTEIETAITALQHLGIYVMRCATMEEVPHAAHLLARTLERPDHFKDDGLALVAHVSPRLGRLATILTSVDGVGSNLAVPIAERFRTFPAFYAATESDLLEIKGLGKVLARRILDQFHSEVDVPSDPFDPEFNPFA